MVGATRNSSRRDHAGRQSLAPRRDVVRRPAVAGLDAAAARRVPAIADRRRIRGSILVARGLIWSHERIRTPCHAARVPVLAVRCRIGAIASKQARISRRRSGANSTAPTRRRRAPHVEAVADDRRRRRPDVVSRRTFHRTRIPFSGNRFEGLFGVTAGRGSIASARSRRPRLDSCNQRVRPEPLICIAIFPPPLSCLMAGGQTLPAFEFGGGVEVDADRRTFFRARRHRSRSSSIPVRRSIRDFEADDEGFYGHALRFTIGAGIRF